MKKKLICFLLALTMLLSCFLVLTSCDDDECTEHVDADNDKKCDKCGEKIEQAKCQHVDENKDEKCDKCGKDLSDGGDEEVYNYPWDKTELLFQLTHNSDKQQLPSTQMRYMAGEDINAVDTIDTYVAERNADAYYNTKVNITYNYYEDVDDYGMDGVLEIIYNNTHSNTVKDNPDIYANFNSTLVACSLKACFANLKSETKGTNYFQFNDADYDEEVDNRGYMFDYMENTTLSKFKMYILASDYCTDLIRAFYTVPVNVTLLESVGSQITGDRNGDEKFTIDDFYIQVQNKEWNYDLVAAYSDKVYKASANNTTGGESIHDILGWALDKGGLCGSGVLYTTPITIIDKKFDDAKNDYKYSYPEESDDIYELCDNLSVLMKKTGVLCVSSDFQQYGNSAYMAIRNRFCDNKILFGGSVLLGSLEYDVYQQLKDKGGFGVVPMPFYHDVAPDSEERYLTAIHVNGSSIAIAVCTTKFSMCTAFLDYQSTHSTDILNEYYDYKLQYQVADGTVKGTVEMLQYIRNNVRSNFDKTMEDTINGYFNAYEDEWHVIICKSEYEIDIRDKYGSLYQTKMDRLNDVIKTYDTLPE